MHSSIQPGRVAIIGFDSLDPGLLKHWADCGHLPTFKKLFSTWAWSPVANPRGFEAGTCWPSMWSGTPPDQHGIHDAFYIFAARQYRIRIATPAEIPVEPFWAPASRSGRQALLVDVPYTFVDRDVSGLQVCDWFVHVRSGDEPIHCSPPPCGTHRERLWSESLASPEPLCHQRAGRLHRRGPARHRGHPIFTDCHEDPVLPT